MNVQGANVLEAERRHNGGSGRRVISVMALLAGVPSAKADELADLRANQELLQQRLDQLSQAGPSTGPSGPITASARSRGRS